MRKINMELGKKILNEGTRKSGHDFVLGNIYPENGITHDMVSTIEESRKIKYNSLVVLPSHYLDKDYIIAEVTDKDKKWTDYYMLDNLDEWEKIKYRD